MLYYGFCLLFYMCCVIFYIVYSYRFSVLCIDMLNILNKIFVLVDYRQKKCYVGVLNLYGCRERVLAGPHVSQIKNWLVHI